MHSATIIESIRHGYVQESDPGVLQIEKLRNSIIMDVTYDEFWVAYNQSSPNLKSIVMLFTT